MPNIELSTRQYTEIMRSIMVAMTLDEHLARERGDKPDDDIRNLWEDMLDRADDFGMSFPTDENVTDHWTDDLAVEADDALHAFSEIEFWYGLADRLAMAEHRKGCEKEHDETCENDIDEKSDAWMRKFLAEDDLGGLLQMS